MTAIVFRRLCKNWFGKEWLNKKGSNWFFGATLKKGQKEHPTAQLCMSSAAGD
jgi:hypothetical protein